ncbi:hypothetical protein B0T17DRAFT_487064 [Bombardia bombarda]|uniref:Glycosyltransferase 2 n=1 Tax=Bombardia bombarda TaxID=252184 RepID=A0AA39X9I9_9PEZI|nr:hypothetical protein B0T17DRAFT_487064 [Bombardia bombarda]
MVSLFLSNEELGKKDDDHKPTKLPPIRAPQWNAARVPPRKTLKRLAIALAVAVFLYIFIKNIPNDLPIRDRRRPVYYTGQSDEGDLAAVPKHKPQAAKPNPHSPGGPKGGSGGSAAAERVPPSSGYNGAVRLPHLAVSLQAIYGTRGSWNANKNVMFAASSLKSAAALLPMACQMGTELRSYVHFALMGGSEISLDDLRTANGIDDSCEVIFHDARPDHPAASTDRRLGYSAERALYHINTYMHPQAVFADGSRTEDYFFLDALRSAAPPLQLSLIELPEGAPSRLGWMTKLDSASLAAWNKVSIDILIHAPPGGSGSLIRLLKSLSAADFTACAIPHLTIELPHKLDPPTAQFLETFRWPPADAYNPTHVQQLTLRHRIPRTSLTEEESSVRFLESFWPADPRHSHILVLSPQAELSPRFFHYLKYSVLEYLHSSAAVLQEWDSRLMGISLDLPSTLLDASEPFKAPSLRKNADPRSRPAGRLATEPSPFLWQAPNSNAVLYMGQKWIELHGLVSKVLELQHTTSQQLSPFFSKKLVSKRYPSWLEHALRLSRARGYWTLYPSQRTASNLAAVHIDLYRAPEEYAQEEEQQVARDISPAAVAEMALAAKSPPLLDSLPAGGNLMSFDDMPLLLWDGRSAVKLQDLDAEAADYAAEFRRAVGGCEALGPDELVPRRGSVRDLFCSREN